jgi:hypothetical protein
VDEGKEKMSMIERVKGLLKRRGFEIYTRPFELNIVGLRNKNPKRSDEIHVFYKINLKNWNYHLFETITDPVRLLKGKNDSLLLKEGQYIDAYAIGLHNEKVRTLIQTRPVAVLENYNRDALLSEGKKKSGLFKIDIIPASALEKGDDGCQVFLSEENFKEFMSLCAKHQEFYGNQFSYSLIDFKAAKRSFFKGIAVAASILSSLLFGYLFKEGKGNKKKNKKK